MRGREYNNSHTKGRDSTGYLKNGYNSDEQARCNSGDDYYFNYWDDDYDRHSHNKDVAPRSFVIQGKPHNRGNYNSRNRYEGDNYGYDNARNGSRRGYASMNQDERLEASRTGSHSRYHGRHDDNDNDGSMRNGERRSR